MACYNNSTHLLSSARSGNNYSVCPIGYTAFGCLTRNSPGAALSRMNGSVLLYGTGSGNKDYFALPGKSTDQQR
jgi:hypothetical protein